MNTPRDLLIATICALVLVTLYIWIMSALGSCREL